VVLLHLQVDEAIGVYVQKTQHTAAHRRTLQRTATRRSKLQQTAPLYTAAHCQTGKAII